MRFAAYCRKIVYFEILSSPLVFYMIWFEYMLLRRARSDFQFLSGSSQNIKNRIEQRSFVFLFGCLEKQILNTSTCTGLLRKLQFEKGSNQPFYFRRHFRRGQSMLFTVESRQHIIRVVFLIAAGLMAGEWQKKIMCW